MQYRTAANSGLAIIGLFSLIGWLGPRILKFINFVQTADGLRKMMNLVAIKDVSISWPGIYLFGLIASFVGIIAINFDWAQKKIREKRERSSWDMNGCDAILYIANTSLLGKTFIETNRSILSSSTFYEAAKTGKIRVAGMNEGSMLLCNIPKRIWGEGNKLDISGCVAGARARSLCIRWKDEEKILYWGLMVNIRDIKKNWPEAPQQHSYFE